MAVTLVPSEDKKRKLEKDGESKSVGRLNLSEVDALLAESEKIIKGHSEIVKQKLSAGASIPSSILRELSRANTQKSRLSMRRIALLVEYGDAQVIELLEKLLKIKPQKGIGA